MFGLGTLRGVIGAETACGGPQNAELVVAVKPHPRGSGSGVDARCFTSENATQSRIPSSTDVKLTRSPAESRCDLASALSSDPVDER